MNVCKWCPWIDGHPIQGVFLPHVQHSQDGLLILCNLNQDKVVIEDEGINMQSVFHYILAFYLCLIYIAGG